MTNSTQLKRRMSAMIVLLIVLAAVLAACGGLPGSAPATSDAAATTAATEAAATSAPAEEAAAGVTPFPTVPPPATVAEGAASALEPAARDGMYTAAPEMTIDPNKFYYATLKTDKGDIKVQLFADRAPNTVNNFVFLAREGFYNDTTFHRVLEGFMAQGGDPTGTGGGGPGYEFANEIFDGATFDRPGLLAMANAGPDTNGSQFFITFGPADWLNGGYSLFGEVVEGQDVLNKLTRRDPQASPTFEGDKLYTVIVEESDSSTLPTPTPLPPTPTPYAPSSVSPTDRPLAAVAPEEKANRFNTAPEMTIDPAKTYTATIATSQGDLVVALNAKDAPKAVNNFVTLADLGFYDNSKVNDVSPGEVIVLGAPTNDPAVDVGYTFQPEVGLPITPTTGSLAFISLNREADGTITASGSQLLIAVSEPPAEVNQSYGFFGQIVQGQDILPSLTVSDTISTITVESK